MTDPLRKAAEELIEAWDWDCSEPRNIVLRDLVEDIRRALAQPEEKMRIEGSGKLTTKPYPDGYESERDFRKALAQPEQEPVAWRNAALRLGEDLYSVGPDGYYDMTAIQWLDWALSVINTAPPKREWVGLTRRELDIATLGLEDLSDCYKAIEAKLKEKNNG